VSRIGGSPSPSSPPTRKTAGGYPRRKEATVSATNVFDVDMTLHGARVVVGREPVTLRKPRLQLPRVPAADARHLAVLEICTPAIQPSPEFGRRGGIEINGRALSRQQSG
jgi:hypothetical protein